MVTTLGPFELTQLLGRGGMGEVWAAIHPGTGLHLAVKRVLNSSSPGFTAEFAHEVRAVAGLDHLGIIRVFDRGVDARGRPWLAMERAKGALDTHPPRSWDALVDVLLQMLDALAHAHARGVVHRDLKPSNTLICDEGRVVLADFGLAWALEDGEARTAGSPGFMAPEQVTGSWRDYGPWTDLYALGATAWELSSGRPIFERTTVRDILRAQLRDAPDPYAPQMAVPEGLQDWLQRCLAKRPADRFANAAEAARELALLGPATSREVPTRRITALPTLTFSTSALPEAPLAYEGRDERHSALPPPEDWRTSAHGGARWVEGLGLGLFALRPAPLSGREDLQDHLWSVLKQVCAGTPQGLVLCGAPGVGKSRLAEWLVRRALEVGAVDQLRVRDTLPDALLDRLHARGLGAPAIAARARALGVAVSDALGAWLSGDDTPSPSTQLQLTLAVADALSARMPLIVWLDDPGRLGQSLARHLGDLPGPILTLVSIRGASPEALAHAPAVTVPPLDRAGAEALARDLLVLDESLVERLVNRAGGNPLFAVRLVANWVGKGWLRAGPRGFTLTDAARTEVPDDLHQLWLREVDRALAGEEPDSQSLVHLLALLPVPASLEQWRTVAAACNLEASEATVERLLDAGLGSVDGGSFRFSHGLLRESTLRAARETRDPSLWSHLASHLAKSDDTAALAGAYFLESGSPERALDPLLDGVIYAVRVRDWDTLDATTALVHQAAAATNAAPDSPVLQRLVEETALVATTRRCPDAAAQLDELERVAEARGWTKLIARVWHARAAEALITGRLRDAVELGERAQHFAVATGCGRTIRSVAGALGSAYIALARLDEAEKAYRLALSYGEGQSEAHVGLAEIALGRGDIAAAREELDRTALGSDVILRVNHAMISGELAWETRDATTAIEQFRIAERLMVALRHEELTLPRMCLAISLAMDHRLDEAADTLRGLAPVTGDYGIVQRLACAAAGDVTALEAVREAVGAEPDMATSAIGHAAEVALRTARELGWSEQDWLETFAAQTWQRLGRTRPTA